MPLRFTAMILPFSFLTWVTLMYFAKPSDFSSCLDCSEIRVAVPPMWKVPMVSCVPGSPIN
jgi:hypothetical protein